MPGLLLEEVGLQLYLKRYHPKVIQFLVIVQKYCLGEAPYSLTN